LVWPRTNCAEIRANETPGSPSSAQSQREALRYRSALSELMGLAKTLDDIHRNERAADNAAQRARAQQQAASKYRAHADEARARLVGALRDALAAVAGPIDLDDFTALTDPDKPDTDRDAS